MIIKWREKTPYLIPRGTYTIFSLYDISAMFLSVLCTNVFFWGFYFVNKIYFVVSFVTRIYLFNTEIHICSVREFHRNIYRIYTALAGMLWK